MNSHLEDNDTTYNKHLRFALFISLKLALLSVAGLVHAIIPLIFQKTVSHGVKDLDSIFQEHIDNPGGTG
tara:strand:- start:69 stop:278 length:210 start_codon:yes stop_codon:yes gene_type:complete